MSRWPDRTLEERFWPKVEKSDGCWLWTGATTSGGYGAIRTGGRGTPMVAAHRFAYELLVGPIPDGLHLDHLCRVRACVNPAHLEPVTCRENLLRGETFNAENAAKTRCVHGHEFTPENTYVSKKGLRHCRACGRERMRVRRAALVAA